MQLNALRKITGFLGFVVFIWCFGAIFSGANDPIFGEGAVRLGIIGVLALVPYLGTHFAQKAIIRRHEARIDALIVANRLSEAEEALREGGTFISREAIRGTFTGLKLLSLVLEKQNRVVDSVKVLKAIVKQCPDVQARLNELEQRTVDGSSVSASAASDEKKSEAASGSGSCATQRDTTPGNAAQTGSIEGL